ncbi:hypothetical protein [Streptomyces chryseus]|uniref:Uncharacterized protein n=1 Tax=Streptomyces chryseus TaxID=68186 RepID=A0ABQ3DMA7_9ACTN|nr:hypothetical protein [Streptomyces chryseus]GHA94381.1 hypothetical protein GCM10010346_16430 [Streptomyces chryseus]
MVAALYSVSAVRIENGERAALLRFDTTTAVLELPELLAAYAADYADQDDVLVDVSAAPAA